MIPRIRMHRFEWQKRWAEGFVLDVGCNDTSEWSYPLHPDSVNTVNGLVFCDLDAWNIFKAPNKFIQANAHKLPFKDNSFDTVVMGELLEHVDDPYQVLYEAKRITKYKIIITVPSEYDWKGKIESHTTLKDGSFPDFAFGDGHYTNEEKMIMHTLDHPSQSAQCIRYINENQMKHLGHQRWFKDDTITQLLDSMNMKYLICKMDYCDEHYITYGIVMWKE